MSAELAGDKSGAYTFLRSLEDRLSSRLPEPAVMRTHVRDVVLRSKRPGGAPHMRQREDAFLYHCMLPWLIDAVKTYAGLDDESTKESLLSEYYRNMPGLSAGSPARRLRHPFNKSIGSSPSAIMSQWKGETSGAALKQSCPDFALRQPFPHRIVFEGKFFENGSLTRAESELVRNIYQAFFYRALPKCEPGGFRKRANWDYEYACLMAYDASPEGSLLAAWNSLAPDVRAGFWDGANVYVMILRGRNDRCLWRHT